MADKINVTVWNEGRHEKKNEKVGKIYPEGIHGAIAAGLNKCSGIIARTATLDEPEHGLTDEVLNNTDVLTWWGHMAHKEVKDEIVEKVYNRVQAGMGLIVLHSGHFSKIFRKLMGTHCSLKWREADEKIHIWNVAPGHELTQGIGDRLDLPQDEMYGEPFIIPEPDKLVFISWFEGGEVFRSGCAYERGQGRIFYFSHGHETYPIFHMPQIQRIIENGVRWARPRIMLDLKECANPKALEKIG
ncbi:MAG: ThuA domain-containing protein [Fibrobacterota bacterium]